jgi:hypothetical protein
MSALVNNKESYISTTATNSTHRMLQFPRIHHTLEGLGDSENRLFLHPLAVFCTPSRTAPHQARPQHVPEGRTGSHDRWWHPNLWYPLAWETKSYLQQLTLRLLH